MKSFRTIIALIVCATGVTVSIFGCGSTESVNNFGSGTNTTAETSNEESQGASVLGEKFEEAAKAIGMDPANIKNVKQLENWASGPRYSFVYDGYEYKVYLLDSGEINSICNGNLTVRIYERGYEPLNYKDFEPDSAILNSLMEAALKSLSDYIVNEDSLKDKLGSTVFYRIYDYYSFNGEVVAKNNVDKKTYTFTVDFLVNGSEATVTYVSIDGEAKYGSQDNIPEVQKVEIAEKDSEESSTGGEKIIISDGKEGSYGKVDLFDGDECIRYYVPTGKYEVTCVVSGGFYVESIELHKEDGWDTATTYDQFMMKAGDKETITIEEGQCISLVMNTELELTPVE